MCGRYPSTRQAPLIGELELAMVDDAALAGLLATTPAMPAGLESSAAHGGDAGRSAWWAPRWNVAPTQPVRTVLVVDDQPRLTLVRWGLRLPASAGKRAPLINARSETAATSPVFRGPLAHRRCLVLADGFYEWRVDGRTRTPVRFAPAVDDGRALTFGAIARRWQQDGLVLDELAILTTAADPLVLPVHDRRPVVIAPAARPRWLDPALPADAIADLLLPAPLVGWTAAPAPPWLNSARLEQAAAPLDR